MGILFFPYHDWGRSGIHVSEGAIVFPGLALGIMPYAGSSFMAYETMKANLLNKFDLDNSSSIVSTGARLASGALAGQSLLALRLQMAAQVALLSLTKHIFLQFNWSGSIYFSVWVCTNSGQTILRSEAFYAATLTPTLT